MATSSLPAAAKRRRKTNQRTRRNPRAARRCLIELLEARWLLAGDLLETNPDAINPAADGQTLASDASSKSANAQRFGDLPLGFEANRGQTDSRVDFLARGDGYALFLTGDEAVLRLQSAATTSAVVRMQLLDANPLAEVYGEEQLPGTTNYLLGNDAAEWITGVENYSRVRYEEIYPGVDVVYYDQQGQLEYDFIVSPGASIDDIQLQFTGVDDLEVDDRGRLIAHVGNSAVVQHAPDVYQQVGDQRVTIDGRYQLLTEDTLSFEISAYDPAYPLVIDPVLTYSTFLGGSSFADFALSIAHPDEIEDFEYLFADSSVVVDNERSAYVLTNTLSTDFPVANALQPALAGISDMVIAKLNPAGTALEFATFLGGTNTDLGTDLAVSEGGEVFLTGITNSSDLPTTSGTVQEQPLAPRLYGTIDAAANWDAVAGIGLPLRGPVTDLAIDPTNSSILFAAAEGDGLYKTSDGGNTWRELDVVTPLLQALNSAGVDLGLSAFEQFVNDSELAEIRDLVRTFGAFDVNDVTLDPSDSQIVYVGSEGLLRSADGGESFEVLFLPLTPESTSYSDVESITVDPLDSSTIYIGTADAEVYKSSDGGATWTPSSTGLPVDVSPTRGEVREIIVDPADSSTLYVGINGFGIFKSLDAGATWTSANSGLGDPPFTDVSDLAIDPQNTSTLYVVVDGNLFKSDNGALTWSPSDSGLGSVKEIEVNPQDPSILYAAQRDSGVFKSTDGGVSWAPANTDLPSSNFVDVLLAIDPSDPSKLYFDAGYSNVEGFVAKLSADGQSLEYGTFLGGSEDDFPWAIAIDQAGAAYVTGATRSSDFPTTLGAFQTTLPGGEGAFVAKLNADASALDYATYLSGSIAVPALSLFDGDVGVDIAVDNDGNAYIAGFARTEDFPLRNPLEATHGGGTDAFVTELNAAGSDLVFSTFLPGSGEDGATAIALAPDDSVVVAGFTESDDFPTNNALQATLGGESDAFVTKLAPEGTALQFSTYLGGLGSEAGRFGSGEIGLDVDTSGLIYVAGATQSPDFPTVDPLQAQLGSSFGFREDRVVVNEDDGTATFTIDRGFGSSAFVSRLSSDGSALDYSTYLGPGAEFVGSGGIVADDEGNAYLVGFTLAGNFPTTGAIQPEINGLGDQFITKIAPGAGPVDDGTVSMQFTTTGVSATEDEDFEDADQQIVFGPDEFQKDVIVRITDDQLFEGTETAEVRLSNIEGPGVFLGSSFFVTGETTAELAISDGVDFGDAPAPYPTLLDDEGARHEIVLSGPFLGTVAPDGEPDGLPAADALGDDGDGADDEDGVAGLMPPLQLGGARNITVTVTTPTEGSLLTGWIDFNGNGNWNDPGEQIFSDQAVVDGSNSLSFNVPGNAATGESYARFRISTESSLAPTGSAGDGEVEDYRVTIQEAISCHLVVTSTNDSGPGSLREAINCANDTPNIDRDGDTIPDPDPISFDIPADDPGHVYYQDDGVAGQVSRSMLATTTASNDAAIAGIDPDHPFSWFSIRPDGTRLPSIDDAVIIDGTTQPQFAASPVIELDGSLTPGSAASGGTVGLDLQAGGSTIRSLIINRFFGAGIRMISPDSSTSTAGDHLVAANYIGTDPSGLIALGNGWGMNISSVHDNTIEDNLVSGNLRHGIGVFTSDRSIIRGNLVGTDITGKAALGNVNQGIKITDGADTIIGGTEAGQGNLISGNLTSGVEIVGRFPGVTDGTIIQGNLIGTDIDGLSAIPNEHGVVLGQLPDGACELGGCTFNTLVGGTSAGAGNVISGNNGAGVWLSDFTQSSVIQGNRIGADITRAGALPNEIGIRISEGASENVIGSTLAAPDPLAGNEISFNRQQGIVVAGPTTDQNSILLNTFSANGGLGIDLNEDGVTANDPGDGDFFPNDEQNFPELTTATLAAGGLALSYEVPSEAPNSSFPLRVEFYLADASGQEGQTFVGADSYAEADGLKTTTLTPVAAVSPGDRIVGTATDAGGNTSEFSAVAVTVDPGETCNLVVTSTNDSGPGSLREAINCANDTPNIDRNGDTIPDPDPIGFNIPADDPGHDYFLEDGIENRLHSDQRRTTTEPDDSVLDLDADLPYSFYQIDLVTALPQITEAVIINGYTQSGARVNTNAIDLPSNAVVNVAINGRAVDGHGLDIVSGDSTVKGLRMSGFRDAAAIRLSSVGGNVVEGAFVGDVFGPFGRGSKFGVLVDNVPNNLIGGTTPAARNVIVSNGEGVVISAAEATDNSVQGNWIGIDASGHRTKNGSTGVTIMDAPGNLIGGDVVAARNVISGNNSLTPDRDRGQIEIIGAGADGTIIIGNYIGPDPTGTKDYNLPLKLITAHGIRIIGAPNTVIGGTGPMSNLISGNNYGVSVEGAGTTGTVIQGNLIGTNATGNDAVLNVIGIRVTEAENVVIGGTEPAAGNLISGNGTGVAIVRSPNNRVQGNLIGTDVTGTKRLENTGNGVSIGFAESTGNLIGGTSPGARNVISGNSADGVFLAGSDNLVKGNYIGTDITGKLAISNRAGVSSGGTGHIVGGVEPGAGNLISGNLSAGVSIAYDSGHIVQGNLIGTDVTGLAALPNELGGIKVKGGTDNVIGGDTAAARNVIAGNKSFGVLLEDAESTGNLVRGNFIGVGQDGDTVVPNESVGVTLVGAVGNTIAENVISGNAGPGLNLDYYRFVPEGPARDNIVQGNLIGTDATGTKPRGNTGPGVRISEGVGNIIGGLSPGAGNVIASNSGDGVLIMNTDSADNVLQGNFIGSNTTRTADLGNAGHGVASVGSGPNLIGSTETSGGNVIAFNAGDGVAIMAAENGDLSTAKVILHNSIYDNGGLGIDLGDDGVTPNDEGDADTGPNNLQNYPVLDSVSIEGSEIVVSGSLNSAGDADFRLEFFASDMADPSGFGEGERPLGVTDVRTDASGNAPFTVRLTPAEPPSGTQWITTTATLLDEALAPVETSEFSGPLELAVEGCSLIVTNTNDSGPGSLREAINCANTLPNIDRDGDTIVDPDPITFNIPLDDPGHVYVRDDGRPGRSMRDLITVTTTADDSTLADIDPDFPISTYRIVPQTPLSEITDPVEIDGFSQPDARANTNAIDETDNAVVRIMIDGDSLRAIDADGLHITAGGSTVRGLRILGFRGFQDTTHYQIHLAGQGENTIAGNVVGDDVFATISDGEAGVFIDGVPDNLIGGTTADARNVIVHNDVGVVIAGAAATNNTLQGNFIGINAEAEIEQNANYGVLIVDAPGNVIGGELKAARNVISANDLLASDGHSQILIEGADADGNRIVGNYIGTDPSGTTDYPSGRSAPDGIRIVGASNTVIGGTDPMAGNLIAGDAHGIDVQGATGTVIQGNYVGTDATGNSRIGLGRGIVIVDSSNTLIGGTAAGAGNLISGSNNEGILLDRSTDTTIQGNLIGTNAAGDASISNNFGIGSTTSDELNGALIGGTTSAARNLISGNAGTGIRLLAGTNIRIQGDYIGTDITGLQPLGNEGFGIVIYGEGNLVGGTESGAGNLVSDNKEAGILLNGRGHVVQGNLVGTDLTGFTAIANGHRGDLPGGAGGVSIGSGSDGDHLIGGDTPAARNIISGNEGFGIRLDRKEVIGIEIRGNYIGVGPDGDTIVSNDAGGVHIQGAVGNTIADNVIAGNLGPGVLIERDFLDSTPARDNVVQGNLLGTNADATAVRGNTGPGVMIDRAINNTIGGTTAGAGNMIGGNGGDGVLITDTRSAGNLVQGNFIGTNTTSTLDLGNAGHGVASVGSGPNVIGSATETSGGNVIAFNAGDGVAIMAAENGDLSTAKVILRNMIYDNGGLGIDLGDDGVTANDDGDADSGPNNLQNYPVLNAVSLEGPEIVIGGRLNSTADTDFLIEFFASDAADPSGFGEGQQPIGFTQMRTDESGNQIFTARLNPPVSLSGTQWITATATLLDTALAPVETSEFSGPFELDLGEEPIITATKEDALAVDNDGDGRVDPGDTIRYTITITNSGDATANGVQLSDAPDENTTLVNESLTTTQGFITAGSSPGDSTVIIDVGTLAAETGMATITFDVIVNDPFPTGVTSVSNQGTVTGIDFDTIVTGVPTETVIDVTAPQVSADKVDALLTDNDGDGRVDPGDTIRYTINISNSGDAAANSVLLSDTPDTNTTLVNESVTTTQGTITAGGSPGDSTVIIDIGALAAEAGMATITFDVIVNDPFPTGVTSVSNQGTVTGIDFDTVVTGVPTETVIDVTAPQVSADKIDALLTDNDDDGRVDPGDTIRYTISINNSGDADANQVLLSDTPDQNTTLVNQSVTTTQGTITAGSSPGDSTVVIDVGTLAAETGMATITFDVIVNDPFPPGVTSVSNQGTMTGIDFDTIVTGVPTETVIDVTAPQVSADKVDALLTDNDGDGRVDPGDTIRYTINISNSGDADANQVLLSDTPDQNTTLVIGSVTTTQGTVTEGDSSGDTSVIVDLASLAAETGMATITFDVIVNDPFPAGVTSVSNQGTVTGIDFDTVVTGVPTVTVIDVTADLSLTKIASDARPNVGDEITFTLTLDNQGPNTASGITVTDVLPTGLMFLRASTTDYNQGTGAWTVATLPDGQSQLLTITALVTAPAPTTNVARVSAAAQPDPDTSDNEDSVTVTPQIADLSLVKTVDDSAAQVGQQVTFTIALSNAGPDEATGVTVADLLPSGLDFVRAATENGDYDQGKGIWDVGSLATNSTATLDIVATLTSQSVRNTAEVATSDQFDPDPDDNQFSVVIGACLTGGPLTVGLNRLVYSCVTPGGFAPFVMGTQRGSYHYSDYGMTVDVADPLVQAIGVGNRDGVATVMVEVPEEYAGEELMFQAFEVLPSQKLSRVLTMTAANDLSGTPLRADDLGVGGKPISADSLPALTDAAIARWEATGLAAADSQLIRSLDVRISDLPGDQLAASHGSFVLIDTTAAGNGWFIDATPSDDNEFSNAANRPLVATAPAATGHIDALTALMHEMGHTLGQDDVSDTSAAELMSRSLARGIRRLPAAIFDPLDANRDRKVSSLDALMIINALAREQSTTPAIGERLGANLDQAFSDYDVNRDGRVSALDALQVINQMRLQTETTQLEGEQASTVIAAIPSRPTLSTKADSLDDDLLRMLADDRLNAQLG